MKKIGIITLNGYVNYGNRLQNYALQEVLVDFGFEVETIIVDNDVSIRPIRRQLSIDKLSRLRDKPFEEVMERFRSEVRNRAYRKRIKVSKMARTQVFQEFTQENIRETDYAIADNNIPDNLADRYVFL